MRTWYKFVSASLMLMALLTPSLSLAICAPASAGSSGSTPCPPGCPMMADIQGQVQGLALNGIEAQIPPCCTIRSKTPAPVSVPSVVAPSVAVEQLVTVSVLALPTVSTPVHETDTSPPPITGSQALLCTFLI